MHHLRYAKIAEVYSCPHCSINLVFHKNKKKLLCHYCGFKSDLNRNCKKGNECDLVFSGSGVERVAEEVKLLFPNKKISIFSSDTMSKKSSLEKLKKIINGEIDILVGTQLISKGFHFPKLNCIVVLDIDLSLNGHDLRVAEKIYNFTINSQEELAEQKTCNSVFSNFWKKSKNN